MPRRIAIVGLGPSHDEVPYEKWEAWGVGWDAWAPRYARIFEMHDRELWEQRGQDYIEKLNDADIPVYMQRRHIEIPKSTEYPLWQVAGEVGDYFGSSPAYMIALAIYEEVDEIGIWGVDLKDSYDHQKPNLEYLIGFARGRGIHVRVNPFSTLLEFRPEDNYLGKDVTYRKRYGHL